MGEQIIGEFQKAPVPALSCCGTFNPVGAHPSIQIGEMPLGKPQNLVPAITQTAIGKLPKMVVWRPITIPAMEVASATLFMSATLPMPIRWPSNTWRKAGTPGGCEVFNLGTGNGVTVLEAIKAFEKVSNVV
jgi:UDP-glucose 4-epimerase